MIKVNLLNLGSLGLVIYRKKIGKDVNLNRELQ